MGDISSEDLRKEITAQLKDADLSRVSAKKVRQTLEKHFDQDLTSRKTEIDKMIMDIVDAQDEEQEEDEEEEAGAEEASDDAANGKDGSDDDYKNDSESEQERAPKRKKPAKKAARGSSSGEEDSDNDETYSPQKKKRAAPKARSSRKAENGSDDDFDAKKSSKKPKAKKGAGTGYTRQYQLSPALAKLMGQEKMARHEVIKNMWAMIKEKDMYDPKNKQYAFCNDDMKEVFGVKRFRTFGMMKYLKDHFIKE